MTTRLLSITIAWLALLAINGSGQDTPVEEEKESPPNFVLILAGDLGYGDLGCYGSSNATPNIDALAGKGILLTDYHSNAAVCSPGRAALLTGLYPHRFGIDTVFTATHHRETGLDPAAITIAERLKKLGYATAIFGKWHLGYDPAFGPNVQGFDEFRGFVSGNVDYFSHIGPMGHLDWWRDGELEADEGYATELITGYGIEYLRRQKDRPFFLILSHAAPGSPFQGPGDEAFRKEGDIASGTGLRGDKEVAYVEMLTALDEGVGAIVAELEKLGLGETTYVIFCSDNGPSNLGSTKPWRGRKGKIWEGGHRVPALISGPGIEAGSRSEEMVMGMDLAPTLLALAGGDLEQPIFDGADLSGYLLHGGQAPLRDLYWSYGSWMGLRRGHWKAMVLEQPIGKPPKPRLYDLSTDPVERKDVASQHPERVEEMLMEMMRMQYDLTLPVKEHR